MCLLHRGSLTRLLDAVINSQSERDGQRERQSVQLMGDMGLRKLRQPDREVRCLKNNEA